MNLSRVDSRKDASLNSGTVGDSFIRVQLLVQTLSIEVFSQHALNFWDSSRSTDQHNLIDLGFGQVCICKSLSQRWQASIEDWSDKLFELGTIHAQTEVIIARQGLDINYSAQSCRKLVLGVIHLVLKTGFGPSVVCHVNIGFSLEVSNAVLNKKLVDVLPTKMRITSRCHDLDYTLLDHQD